MPLVNFLGDQISFPDSMTEDEVSDVLGALFASTQAVGEFVVSMGTGAAAEAVSGVVGVGVAALRSNVGQGAETVRNVREALTYQPRTRAGQVAMQSIANDVQQLGQAVGAENVSGYWRDRVVPALQDIAGPVAGSVLAAVGLGSLAAVSELSPARPVRGAMRGTQGGMVKAFQGSPHQFNQERLVKLPDGSTQFIEGTPNALPDIPEGSELLQDFPLGRQRTDKIGTGEGAQAYGHGLYAAENIGVARGYQSDLTYGQAQKVTFKGKDPKPLAETTYDNFDTDQFIAELARLEGGDLPFTQDRNQLAQYFIGKYQQNLGDRAIAPNQDLFFARQDELFEAAQAFDPKDLEKSKPGSLLELEIDVDPEDLLDWDKPLSEQSERVQDFIKANKKPRPTWRDYRVTEADKNDFDGDRYPNINPGQWIVKADDGSWGGVGLTTRKEAQELALIRNEIPEATDPKGYVFLEQHIGKGKEGADKMRAAGIKGIKYADAFSRQYKLEAPRVPGHDHMVLNGNGQIVAKGSKDAMLKFKAEKETSNFVIFDDRLINISKKLGVSIPIAAEILREEERKSPGGLLDI